jgi:hypothetical protein
MKNPSYSQVAGKCGVWRSGLTPGFGGSAQPVSDPPNSSPAATAPSYVPQVLATVGYMMYPVPGCSCMAWEVQCVKVRDSGDTTSCRMTGVTLKSHVHYTETDALIRSGHPTGLYNQRVDTWSRRLCATHGTWWRV